jgi:hypothetical protein
LAAKRQKQPKTWKVSGPKRANLTKTIEILMKRWLGCFGISQGYHEMLAIINYYFQQASGTSEGSRVIGKGNREFFPCSSPTKATS